MKVFFRYILIGTLAILYLTSCKKYADTPPYFEEIDTLRVPPNRKVLMIGVEGFSSKVVQEVAPAKLMALLQKSKYSWDAISDRPSNSATGWKTLTSGVQSSKHAVYDSTFRQDLDHDATEGAVIRTYPSMFNLLLSSTKPDLKTSVIARWPALVQEGMPEVSNSIVLSSDLAIKDTLVQRLKTTKDDIVVAEFNDLAVAGVQFGFTKNAPEYVAAINKLADYIDEIMTSLKSRPGYNSTEEWLVIISGINGGTAKSMDGGTVDERQVPLIYYNERLKPLEFSAQGINLNVTMQGNSGASLVRARLSTDASNLFNFGRQVAGSKQYTVQFKMLTTTTASWPVVFSKSGPSLGDNTGWSVFLDGGGGNWQLDFAGRRMQRAFTKVNDGNWHTCTFVLYDSINRRWIKRLTDGKRIVPDDVSRDITNFNLSNTRQVTLGFADFTSGGNTLNTPPITFADIAIFDTAMSDDEIASNLCVPMPGHIRLKNLIGYWPGNDGFQNLFSNSVNPQQPFVIQGAINWANLNKVPCNITNTTAKAGAVQTQFQTVDVPQQIFYWMGVSVPASWGIDGVKWLDKYEIEFYQP